MAKAPKKQTAYEKQLTAATIKSDRQRWEYLLSLNVWQKPTK